jgi:hypothetical protein
MEQLEGIDHQIVPRPQGRDDLVQGDELPRWVFGSLSNFQYELASLALWLA